MTLLSFLICILDEKLHLYLKTFLNHKVSCCHRISDPKSKYFCLSFFVLIFYLHFLFYFHFLGNSYTSYKFTCTLEAYFIKYYNYCLLLLKEFTVAIRFSFNFFKLTYTSWHDFFQKF